MSEYQILELILSVSTKQDALWAIFFSVHMALFGGIIYVDRPLKGPEKIFAITAYLVFAVMNFVALRAGQRIISALRTDLVNLHAGQQNPSETMALFESTGRFAGALEPVTVGIHILAVMLVIGAILFDQARPSLSSSN